MISWPFPIAAATRALAGVGKEGYLPERNRSTLKNVKGWQVGKKIHILQCHKSGKSWTGRKGYLRH